MQRQAERKMDATFGLAACPVCDGGSTLVRFEPALDVDGNTVDVLQCRACMCLINSRAHTLLQKHEIEEVQLTNYYISESLTYGEAQKMLSDKAVILNYLYEKLDRDFSHKVFCDFGGGSGLIAIAAANKFMKSYICEFDTRSVEHMCAALGKPRNMEIVTSLDSIEEKIDVFFMWHVLEHIPNPREFLEKIKEFCAEDCIFFLQCPGYRPSSIVDCHYTFFNEPSMRALFSTAGFKEVEIGFDLSNGFIGYLGKMNNS